MATIKEVKTQIQNANALGRANLTEKGVEISENATTFDIMTAIAEISGSGGGDVIIGADYTNIVYNEDNTITLTGKDGVEHTMSCNYEDGKLIGVTYDGKAVELTYDGEDLVEVGSTNINLSKTKMPSNKEIEAKASNQELFVWSTNEKIYKANDGVCLCGIFKDTYDKGTFSNPVVVAKTREAALFLHKGSYESRVSEFEYNGETYYRATYGLPLNVSASNREDAPIPKELASTTSTNAATELLDYYYGVSEDFQNGFALGLASGGVVEVVDTTEIDNLETLIDESGVLDSTEGTVTEKVEELIGKAEELDVFTLITHATELFKNVSTFPSKAAVNLPNTIASKNAFSLWKTAPIPIVEELTINGFNIVDVEQMFYNNHGVKKVVLNLSDECKNMASVFSQCLILKEAILNFSTKNITTYVSAFNNCPMLEKIIGVLDFSNSSVGYMFFKCENLEDVTFEPNTLSLSMSLAQSSKLTSESVQSIIDGLATVETAQTLTLNSAIVLTDEQKATINAKGWTLAQ